MCGGCSERQVTDAEEYQIAALKEVCQEKGHEFVKIISFKSQVVAGFKFYYEAELTSGNAHIEIWHKPGNKAYECVAFEVK